MTIYSSNYNEQKATNNAWNAYRHVKNHLDDVYDTCTDEELNNLIHNVETLAGVLEAATLDLIEPYDQRQIERMISHKVEQGIYPKL
ncbi:hypothetical protein NVP1193O_227 [Vibrio phage 1.193.O._10N.286.52.C6]|nr:hypothetical protein NVP1193O_227 [Vibrio phage 1.193.O._10N.286.52.C6]